MFKLLFVIPTITIYSGENAPENDLTPFRNKNIFRTTPKQEGNIGIIMYRKEANRQKKKNTVQP